MKMRDGAQSRVITLGTEYDLHRGVHFSLASHPPEGVRYKICDALHSFIWEREASPSPFHGPHLGEFIDFGRTRSHAVHSSRWPVIESPAWIVDMDDLGYPLLGGRYSVNPHFQSEFRYSLRGSLGELLRKRAANMLSAYTHESCKAVFFRSTFTLNKGLHLLKSLTIPHDTINAFKAKVGVLYPAQPACPPDALLSKWSTDGPLEIVFVGREYETKNGSLALAVLRELARYRDLAITYVGDIPASEAYRYRDLLENIHHHRSLPRTELLALLARSHVLFHPSKFEGFGTVFIEAAAFGLAVVVACGRDMSHVAEIFDDGGARLIDRDRIRPEDEAEAFLAELTMLVSKRSDARALGFANHAKAEKGRFSLAERDARLSAAYGLCDSPHKGDAFTLGAVPFKGLQMSTITTRQVGRAEDDYRRVAGVSQRRFTFSSPSAAFDTQL